MELMGVIVAQATGVLMARLDVGSDEAYQLVRAEADDRHITLDEVAAGIIESLPANHP